MKKIFAVLVALILVIGCSAIAVSAAPSPEVKDLIKVIDATDADGNPVTVKLVKLEETIKELKPTSKDEATIGQYEIEIEGTPKYPVTVNAEIAGIKTSSSVYALVKKADGSVEKVAVSVAENGKIKFELKAGYNYISFITDKKTATDIGVSDKTGDNTSTAVMAVLCLAIATAAVSVKKIKE